MRTVYESLQSYLGFLSDERKAKEGNVSRRYGFYILKRSMSSNDGAHQLNHDDQQKQQPFRKRISSTRVHSVVSGFHGDDLGKRILNVGMSSGSHFVSTEGFMESPALRRGHRSSHYCEGLFNKASPHNDSQALETARSHWKSRLMEKWNLKVNARKPDNRGDATTAELRIEATKERRAQEDCLNVACKNAGAATVQSVRNFFEDSFDASTIQYYSAGKRGAQSSRCAREQPGAGARMSPAIHQSLSPRFGGHEKNPACAKTNPCNTHELAIITSKPRAFEKLFSVEDDSSAGAVVEAERMKVHRGNNITNRCSVASSNDRSGESSCVSEASHAEVSREGEEHDCLKMEAKVRFSDLQEEDEKDEDGGCVLHHTAPSPSSNRDGRRKFPPPLTSLSMHGHSSQPPSSSVAGVCLRSMRKDGRFMLQEVKAPPQKFFRAVRKDGRLRLELLDPVDDVLQETSLPGERSVGKVLKEDDASTVLEQQSLREAFVATKSYFLEQQSNYAVGSCVEMAVEAGIGSSVDIGISDGAAVAMNSIISGGKDTNAPGGGFSCAEMRDHRRQSDRASWIRSTDWVPAF